MQECIIIFRQTFIFPVHRGVCRQQYWRRFAFVSLPQAVNIPCLDDQKWSNSSYESKCCTRSALGNTCYHQQLIWVGNSQVFSLMIRVNKRVSTKHEFTASINWWSSSHRSTESNPTVSICLHIHSNHQHLIRFGDWMVSSLSSFTLFLRNYNSFPTLRLRRNTEAFHSLKPQPVFPV